MKRTFTVFALCSAANLFVYHFAFAESRPPLPEIYLLEKPDVFEMAFRPPRKPMAAAKSFSNDAEGVAAMLATLQPVLLSTAYVCIVSAVPGSGYIYSQILSGKAKRLDTPDMAFVSNFARMPINAGYPYDEGRIIWPVVAEVAISHLDRGCFHWRAAGRPNLQSDKKRLGQ